MHWTTQNIKDYFTFKAYSDSVLKPIFNPTFKSGPFRLDEKQGLYQFETSPVFYVKDLADVRFFFQPTHRLGGVPTDSFFSKTVWAVQVNGLSKARFIHKNPLFEAEVLISVRDKAYYDVKDKQTRLPDKLLVIQQKIINCLATIGRINEKSSNKQQSQATYKNSGKKKEYHYEEYRREPSQNSQDIELIKAMNLFMFDNLEGLTESDIRKQRNKLLKAFHPDKGEESALYAQRINRAYDLLIKNI